MKIKLLTVIAFILMLTTVQICADTYKFSIQTTSDFTYVTAEDNFADIAKKLDMTESELASFFNKNGLLYLAVSKDLTTQIRLSAFTDNFSSAVGDISYLGETEIEEFMQAVCPDGNCSTVTINERKFIKTVKTLTDSGGVYTITQYITVCGGETYYLSCYNSGEETSELSKTVSESFVLTKTNQENSVYSTNRIIIVSGIIIFSVIAVVCVIGIFKGITKKGKEKQ